MNPQIGDIVVFRRKGFVSWVLGGLLKLFERDWDGWGWHMGILWERCSSGWVVFESLGSGVSDYFHTMDDLKANAKCYRWIDRQPTKDELRKFSTAHISKRYDAAVYFWTVAQYLLRHWFHHKLPLILDDRYSCWELADEWADYMGKPWERPYDFPMITDFMAQHPQEIAWEVKEN